MWVKKKQRKTNIFIHICCRNRNQCGEAENKVLSLQKSRWEKNVLEEINVAMKKQYM